MNSHNSALPPRTRAVFSPWTILVLMAVLVCAAGSALAADPARDNLIHRFFLQPGLTGVVDADGGLVFLGEDFRVPLLQAELIPRQDSRRRRDGDQFHHVVTEGAPGGHRGFSERADDDGDGRIDEDILDGRDNDGDGAVDEDFAAIGDAMVAVNLQDAASGHGVHLEYYHWTHSHLSSAVFLNAGGGTATSGRRSFSLRTDGSVWLETATTPVAHTNSGELTRGSLTAMVCRVDVAPKPTEDPCAPGSYRWLGAMILSDNPSKRFLHNGDQIELPLGETPVPMVVCVADTWLQLNRILSEAQGVFEGLTDPVDKRTTPWIVPAVCTACRAAKAPTFSLKAGSGQNLVLTADVASGQCGLLDPDLFQIKGRPLGAPEEIRWQPAGGLETTVAWSCRTTGRLEDLDSAEPFSLFADLMGHKTEGRLTFVFARARDSRDAGTLAGRYLDGRPLKAKLVVEVPDEAVTPVEAQVSLDPEPGVVEETARGYAEDRARLLEQERGRISLSPELLVGWPNPFSDNINIRFTVPRTMKEAFVWADKDNQPTEIDLEGDVPWSSGQPGVSVKIYNVNGQELVTLHSANEGAGEYTVHWNGTDAYGRKVASGPYFCKLQMDDWSVTRQFVFLR